MGEFVKIIGAVAWLLGILFFFVFPPVGIVMLLVALIITIGSAVSRTRSQRHDEMLQAMRVSEKQSQTPPVTSPKSTADELAKLVELRDQGFLTDSEFEAAKKKYLGERS